MQAIDASKFSSIRAAHPDTRRPGPSPAGYPGLSGKTPGAGAETAAAGERNPTAAARLMIDIEEFGESPAAAAMATCPPGPHARRRFSLRDEERQGFRGMKGISRTGIDTPRPNGRMPERFPLPRPSEWGVEMRTDV
ncbi:hypothetical protein GCM10010425_76520 [Streptomyces spororaveus]|uniref:Uncharacterized protein n=1 Tax=Streptomyces spororaveus TaxID=284039 RepID=A0ABQ3T3F4_9ACTN|nr:hypothetical protein Sspor_04700 [Streptomyces spororaveus]